MQKGKNLPKNSKFPNYIINAPKLETFRKEYLQIEASIRNSAMPILQSKIFPIQQIKKIGQKYDNLNIKTSCLDNSSKIINLNNTLNKRQPKQTVKKMRKCTTEKDECVQQKQSHLKKYFNSVSKTCSYIQKPCLQGKEQSQQDRKRKEHKKFMMNQLSFTVIDQEKLQVQKRKFQKFSQLKGHMASKISRFRMSIGTPKQNHTSIITCLKLIDKVYKYLNELQDLGYAKKSNKYIISYCTSNQSWLAEVFLYESKDKNGCFSLNFKYYVVPTSDEAKTNFTNFISRNMCVDIKLIEKNFQMFMEYVQQLFIHKKQLQLNQVSQYLEYRLSEAKKLNQNDNGTHFEYSNLRIQAIEDDEINLTDDIMSIQQRFGHLKQISKISRRRYEALNQTYQKLHDLL